MSRKKEKDIIIGDIHGTNESLTVVLNNIGYKVDRNSHVNIGSPAESMPGGKVDLPSIIETLRSNMEQNQLNNDSHHDTQYSQMHPKKLK